MNRFDFEKLLKEEKKHTAAEVVGVILGILLILGLAFGLCCLEVWIAMSLWNGLLVPMFGAPTITFWPMWGIMLLCNILFKSHNFNNNKKD